MQQVQERVDVQLYRCSLPWLALTLPDLTPAPLIEPDNHPPYNVRFPERWQSGRMYLTRNQAMG